MSTINYHKREIVAKIVYYGPALGGKTSSLEFIHKTAKGVRGDLISLTTDEDRTLYFDYLPVELPKLGGFSVRVQLYTVPGQVYYNATRKLVLDGADGVVFVADSQSARMSANVESLDNLVENLREKRCALKGLPEVVSTPPAPDGETNPSVVEEISWVIEVNKRDLPGAIPLATLEEQLNLAGVPSFETVATQGTGILEALQSICLLVLADVRDKGRLREGQARIEAEKTLSRIGGAPMIKDGSMTATSLADITDVVAKLSDDAADAYGADSDDEPVTQPGVGTAASPAARGSKRRPTYRPTEVAPVTEARRREPATSPGLPAVRPMSGRMRPSATDVGEALVLSPLVRSRTNREALVTVESHIRRGNWKAAIEGANAAFADFSGKLARTLGPQQHIKDRKTFAALATAMPVGRLLRFEAITARLSDPRVLSADDALFAAFFLADFLLRLDDLEDDAAAV